MGDFASYVDPLIGTAGSGNCFPGPCFPFGMAQPGPDSGDGSRNWCGGYKHGDTLIRGFSQTHLSGTGRPGMGDLRLLPLGQKTECANVKVANTQQPIPDVHDNLRASVPPCETNNPVNPVNPVKKVSETAEIGYYAVTLDGGIRCEATAGERCAVWRFSWPKGTTPRLFVDAAAMLMQPFNAKFGLSITEAACSLGDDRMSILGGKTARGWTLYTLFWAVRFSHPWAKIERVPGGLLDAAGDRFVLDFSSDAAEIEVRIGLSTVSAEAAEKNLVAEADGRSFEDIRARCRAAWNALLSRAQLVRGSEKQKRCWYTALYHCCTQPNVISDIDGHYRGDDGEVHQSRRGHYSTFSLWDTFRAVHPLYTLVVPEKIPVFMDSILATGREHGHLPTWAMWGHETHCMVGMHAIAVLADAWSKGFRDFDADEAFQLMVKSLVASDAERPNACWNAIWENGYVPWKAGVFDEHLPTSASVTITLETAYDFACMARFAQWLGRPKAAEEAGRWADIWRNLFDAKTGFFRPRAPQTDGGAFREPFDPCRSRVPGAFWPDYTEQTPWINLWFVPHDPEGLADAIGGREAAVAKLDEFFATEPLPPDADNATTYDGGRMPDGSLRPGQIGQDWHGNEPSLHIPFLYSLWGRREKTAAMCRRIADEFYTTEPDGICGNDDCGALSAWYLFATMGFYPVDPCGAGYVLGEALADEIRLALPNGKILTILGDAARPELSPHNTPHLNSAPLVSTTITHAQLLASGTLDFMV